MKQAISHHHTAVVLTVSCCLTLVRKANPNRLDEIVGDKRSWQSQLTDISITAGVCCYSKLLRTLDSC